jgi:thiol-disulfide isomerase/thioredoxin
MAAHTEQPTDSQPKSGSEVVLPAMKDSAGNEFRLETLRRGEGREGKITVLTIWCTTCHSCRVIEHDFDKKAKEYEAKGVRFLMVASSYTDTPESVNQFLAKHGLGFTVLMDPESDVPRYFGAKTTTTTAVIDAAGHLRYYGGFPKAEDAVRNLLANEDVAVPETRGFG